MARKDYYTGKQIYLENLKKNVVIGKVSGWRGTGEPVYEVLENNVKIGEIGNNEIKKLRKS